MIVFVSIYKVLIISQLDFNILESLISVICWRQVNLHGLSLPELLPAWSQAHVPVWSNNLSMDHVLGLIFCQARV